MIQKMLCDSMKKKSTWKNKKIVKVVMHKNWDKNNKDLKDCIPTQAERPRIASSETCSSKTTGIKTKNALDLQ